MVWKERDILERGVLVIGEQAASASGVIDEALAARCASSRVLAAVFERGFGLLDVGLKVPERGPVRGRGAAHSPHGTNGRRVRARCARPERAQSGTHSVTMSVAYADFERLAGPTVADIDVAR